ncbi:MAG: four helix bundle protein [Endomicrobiia bacterium]
MNDKEYISPHKKLLAWQEAFSLCKEVYQIVEKFPKSEMFSIIQQIRRSAVSIVSNIAEGAARTGGKEKIKFFITARGSLAELETQLLLAKELGYYFNHQEIFDKIQQVGKLLNGLIQSKRKIIKNLLLLFFPITYLLSPTCCLLFSAFQSTDWSVRAESMGGVFTALSDEPSGIYYNPSGSTWAENNYIQIMYSKPFLAVEGIDISLTNIAGIFKTKYICLGLGYGSYNVENSLYKEDTIVLNFSKKLDEIYDKLPPLSLGLNFKYLTKKYIFDEEILNLEPQLRGKESKSVVSLDFGTIYKFLDKKMSIGLNVKDFNQPNIAVLEGNEDIIPMSICFGSSYNFGDIKAGLYFEDFTLGIELRYRTQNWGDEDTKIFYAIGLETYLNFHTIPIRFGVNKNSFNLGFGYQGIKIAEKIAVGFGYNFGLPVGYTDTLGNHRISVDVKF